MHTEIECPFFGVFFGGCINSPVFDTQHQMKVKESAIRLREQSMVAESQ